MKNKISLLVIGLICLSGCSSKYEDLELSYQEVSNENVELVREIEKVKAQNEAIQNELLSSENRYTKAEEEFREQRIEIGTEREQLRLELESVREELEHTRSWSKRIETGTEYLVINDHKAEELFNQVMTQERPPIYGVIFCDMYLSQIDSVDVRSALIHKLHKTLVDWELKYMKSIKEIVNETVEGDYIVRMQSEWKAIGMVESDVSELHQLKNKDLRSLLIEAKYSGYIADRAEEVVFLEYDRSLIIEKYGHLLSDDLVAYLELEDLMNRYGSWYSEEASNRQLELIKLIKENYLESEYRTISPEILNGYEEELKYQLENIMHWGSYGWIDISANDFAC